MDVGRRRDVIGEKDMSNAYQYTFVFLSTTYVVFSLLMQTVCKYCQKTDGNGVYEHVKITIQTTVSCHSCT
jgi:hypothetical protein